ncbi:hypothetical protein NPIL_558281, partial [Nephila pilipes]
ASGEHICHVRRIPRSRGSHQHSDESEQRDATPGGG